ncbi:EAL domain-containing protein [Neobacillus notoginsengisoli]|uniref:EAL domain-containing protein n=1 Tax=Neobacillus notoginsengisoli TaxID=1578198 RepID=A0A417YWP1_9BACI|nr:EAL domain-containing protein [Neobacillus notoginsengisoli]RHW41734.1 EAL domain-containing protein [Neobacillus notoginsengisoli]
MKNILFRNRGKKLIIFFIIVVLAAEISSIFLPLNEQILHALILLAASLLLLVMLKGVNLTTEELQKNRHRLDAIFDSLDVAIWSHDLKTNHLKITPGIEKLYGYSLAEFYHDHNLWKRVIHPDDMVVLPERDLALSKGEAITSIYRIIRPDGEIRWIQDRGIPTVEKGKLVNFSSVLFDITDKKESENRYRSLVEMSPDIIAVYSRGKIDYVNETGAKVFGAKSPEEMIGMPLSKLIPTKDLNEMRFRELTIGEERPDEINLEFQAVRIDGQLIDVEMVSMPIFYEGRAARQIVGRDISERKAAEQTIQFMAYNDGLTGLPNRNRFREKLLEAMSRNKAEKLAILFLDLDRFKIINDTKGHTVGDQLLKAVADRLSQVVGSDGIVSRQGGDEFIILLEGMDRQKIIKVAKRILNSFSKPFAIDHEVFYVTPSIGISVYPSDGEDGETLIKHADIAMYLAKDRGKNNYQFYTAGLHGLSSRKMEMETGLRKALELNQFELYYQPQIELSTGYIIGIESLIRWNHPERGIISPCEFIPLAEETGLIVPIGNWVLKEACKQHRSWLSQGYWPMVMSVNISVRQFQDDDFVSSVKRILNETDMDPGYLELEITESIMQNFERSNLIIKDLNRLGVKIALDDFGTGYSSLSNLKHLPIDTIKIDKSFLDDMEDGSMVKTILDMGLNMEFHVIAEGIEQKEQVDFLLVHGCKVGQGYLFSEPISVDGMEGMLNKKVLV